MRILGHGIDLVQTERIQRMLELHGQRFLQRCFTAAEQSGVSGHPGRRAEQLAGRFAAKEAVFKALGTGWAGGVCWTDVEVLGGTGGPPTVRLHGRCRVVSDEKGVQDWWLSISHERGHALASAIAVGG